MTLADAINKAASTLSARGVSNARLDAEVLLRFILNRDRAWFMTHANEPLDEDKRGLFEKAVARRAKREPLQYIVGKQEFWGLDFIVRPEVLIPRPETELVVETALKITERVRRSTEADTPFTIVDLCTGSGCIAVSLAREMRNARFFAIDTSGKALAVARENARKHGVSERIRFLKGDLFQPLEELDFRSQVDIVTANPPYIRSGDLRGLQPEVRDYEPEIALIAGPEGGEIHQKIIEAAPAFLKKHGSLIMEMGEGQAEALIEIMNENGKYAAPEILKDLAGIERVIVAKKK
ncbi:MAG: protein-(glutamine-N5) methyltransferase, release factor-specific [Nitrospirae bacterium RBG_19FT_COMBO_55_12]|nr:MAG: protein-(glutamine-N5) methyltransferase, release factor-specific [Nitrospirae bacterium RBG_19FT_COMBO_55_12]